MLSIGFFAESDAELWEFDSDWNAGGARKSGCSCDPILSLSLSGKRGLGRMVLPGIRRNEFCVSFGRSMSLCPMIADRFFSGTLNVLFGGRITCGGGLLIL